MEIDRGHVGDHRAIATPGDLAQFARILDPADDLSTLGISDSNPTLHVVVVDPRTRCARINDVLTRGAPVDLGNSSFDCEALRLSGPVGRDDPRLSEALLLFDHFLREPHLSELFPLFTLFGSREEEDPFPVGVERVLRNTITDLRDLLRLTAIPWNEVESRDRILVVRAFGDVRDPARVRSPSEL